MEHKVYKITNLLDKKFYIGVTQDTLKARLKGHSKADSHIGRAIRKYGIENFKIEEIYSFESKEESYNKEAEIVNEDFLKRDDVYNKKEGGQGGFDHINNNPKYKGMNVGYFSAKDKNGNIKRITKEDPRYISGELEHVCKDTAHVIDSEGNTFRVSLDDPRYLSGELVGHTQGTFCAVDEEGIKHHVSKDDPRYLSGELVAESKGRVVSEETKLKKSNKLMAKDKDGNKFYVSKDDPRYLSGELVAESKGRVWISNDSLKKNKLASKEDSISLLKNGWKKGRKKYD